MAIGPRPARARMDDSRCTEGLHSRREPPQASQQGEPAQGLVNRMMVDAEVLGDSADAETALLHLGRATRDLLVDRGLGESSNLDANQNLSHGAKPLRTRRCRDRAASNRCRRRGA